MTRFKSKSGASLFFCLFSEGPRVSEGPSKAGPLPCFSMHKHVEPYSEHERFQQIGETFGRRDELLPFPSGKALPFRILKNTRSFAVADFFFCLAFENIRLFSLFHSSPHPSDDH